MKTVLKNIFTQGDNETYSFMRICVLPPAIIIFNLCVVFFSFKLKSTLLQIALSYLAFFCAVGIGAFFFRLYEDGVVKNVIGKLTDKVSV